MAISSFLLDGLLLALLAGASQGSGVLITQASNVQLRAAAAASASVLASLPVGTELTAVGGSIDGRWRRVKTAEGVEGFVAVSLVREVPEGRRADVIEALIGERLAREGDGFPARVELLDLVERAARDATEGERRGRLALARLRALDGALDAIPFQRARSEPYASWLKARDPYIHYNEPGGNWMMDRHMLVALQDEHRTATSSDEIAWFVSTYGLGGECEGDNACNASRTNDLWGEYLRRHPEGRHAGEALDHIVVSFSAVPALPETLRDLNPAPDCAGIIKALDPLRRAVAATEQSGKSAALASIERLRSHCR